MVVRGLLRLPSARHRRARSHQPRDARSPLMVRLGKPVAAVNLGRTRADHLLALKVERPVGETLEALARTLTATAGC